jgi:diacylglycerol kinase (ATP)
MSIAAVEVRVEAVEGAGPALGRIDQQEAGETTRDADPAQALPGAPDVQASTQAAVEGNDDDDDDDDELPADVYDDDVEDQVLANRERPSITTIQPPLVVAASPAALKMIGDSDIPLICFVNGRSGGGMGRALLARFRRKVGEEQVFDLGQVGRGGPSPEQALARFVDVPNVRVLVCGGDGTCSWILAAVAAVLSGRPEREGALPIAVMPLGTGNDLSRALGWGAGFKRSMGRRSWLKRVAAAQPMALDRWSVTVEACEGLPSQFGPVSGGAGGADAGATARRGVICNYFGVGVEAGGLHAFHTAREAAPHRFKSRLMNQAKMVAIGVPSSGVLAPCCGRRPPQLASAVRLSVMTAESPPGTWDVVELPPRLVAMILVNIKSHAAGRRLWEPVRAPWAAQRHDDALIEIGGFASPIHFGLYLGFGFGRLGACSATKLAQATAVRIELLEALHVQADGEPWLQPPGVITVDHAGASSVLRAPDARALAAAKAAATPATRTQQSPAPA